MSGIGSGNNSSPLGQRVSDAAKQADAQNKIKQDISGSQNNGHDEVYFTQDEKAFVAASIAGAMVGGAVIGAAIGGAGIAIGAILKLPGNDVYTIEKGDTLASIAKKTLGDKATPDQINKFIDNVTKLNSDIIKDQDKIYAGDKIAIPDSGHKEGSAKAEISFIDGDTVHETKFKISEDVTLNSKSKYNKDGTTERSIGISVKF
jgi:nucleoid-associated protein YgaU